MEDIFGKKETATNPDERLETIVQTLRNLPGPDFINKLREIKTQNPDIENLIENYTEDKRFREDIRYGLFFLKKEEPGHEWSKNSAFLSDIEHFYWPEERRKNNRHEARVWKGLGAVMGGLAIAGGFTFYQMKQQEKEHEMAEKNWEKQKITLSLDEIEQQADTIFDGVTGNIYLYQAYDTLNETVEHYFDIEHASLEKDSRTDIVEYLDSLQLNNPEQFKNLTLEYWKSQNGLPNNYSAISESPTSIDEPMQKAKKNFAAISETLNNREKALMARILTAYQKAGNSITWNEAVERAAEQERVEKEKVAQEVKTDPEVLKFTEHVDSLARADSAIVELYQKYSDALASPLRDEVAALEKKLNDADAQLAQTENNIKNDIEAQKNKKIQELVNQNAQESHLAIGQEDEIFNQDMWDYLEDYYLVHAMFDDKLKDTVSENSLKAMGENPVVKNVLARLSGISGELKKSLAEEMTRIKNSYDDQKDELLREARFKSGELTDQIKAELEPKKQIYTTTWNEALNIYNQKYNELWNSEVKKQNNPAIKPR